MRPFFSVVIDNHNYGRFLRATIDSALGQDFPAEELEVIVVDDGSTDDSRAILAGYGSRIHAVLQPRQGQATAFNRGFAEARGEIVALLDSDDIWWPGKLTAVAECFKDRIVGVAEHWLQDTDAQLRPLPQGFPSWPQRYRLQDFLAGATNFTATSGLCLRRELLARIGPIPEELFYYLDDFLLVGALFHAEAANVPRILGAHRVHGGNWCAQGLADPRKIDVDLRMREIFSAQLERWLAESGRSLTARYADLWDLEVWRRRVLQAALHARPGEAWGIWRLGFNRFAGSAFGRFRLLSALLAVVSPTLYLWGYGLYSRNRSLQNLRRMFFPEA